MAAISMVEQQFCPSAPFLATVKRTALIWIMPFWPPYEVEAVRGRMQSVNSPRTPPLGHRLCPGKPVLQVRLTTRSSPVESARARRWPRRPN